MGFSVVALAFVLAASEIVSATRNITTPPVIIPLSFSYNTTFSPQAPGRFLASISIGTPPQAFKLALDISRPDNEIRQDFVGLTEPAEFRNLLFKNSSSNTFVGGTPENDINGWLGNGPTDNITLGNLRSFRTGWNRWNHTETINLSPQQREEMVTYGTTGTLGVHGPACAVNGGSWFTSLVADGGAPIRTWGMYFSGGYGDPDSNGRMNYLDGDTPNYTAMLFLGGYQPSKFAGKLSMVANITYNNASPVPLTSTSLPRDPHLLPIDYIAINASPTVSPPREEGIFVINPNSLFSNFTTRAQAASFAAALGASAEALGAGRTQYTFTDCTVPGPTQNVEIVFPPFPAGSTTPALRISIPPSSLKILKEGTCYLSFQEPWDPVPPLDQQLVSEPPRGTLGLSFLRNIYLHTDYDASTYSLAPRAPAPPTTATSNSVFPIPNPPAFVLDQCWNSIGTPTGVIKGEYQESWYRFPVAFREYYAPVIGPPWVYRITPGPEGVTVALAVVVLPVGALVVLLLAWVNKKVGHTIVGKEPLMAPPRKN